MLSPELRALDPRPLEPVEETAFALLDHAAMLQLAGDLAAAESWRQLVAVQVGNWPEPAP